MKAIIWDLGGVLVRTEDRRAREKLAARLGLTYDQLNLLIFDSESARLATLGKMTTKEHWRQVQTTLKLEAKEFSHVPPEFWGGDRLDLDLVGYIRSLRPRYKTALLSNAWDNLRQVLETHWKILDAFDEVIVSAEVGLAKPDPRIYLLAVERLGVEASEAIFIDDFLENVEAARKAGLSTIHFRSPTQTLQELDEILDPKPSSTAI